MIMIIEDSKSSFKILAEAVSVERQMNISLPYQATPVKLNAEQVQWLSITISGGNFLLDILEVEMCYIAY